MFLDRERTPTFLENSQETKNQSQLDLEVGILFVTKD